MTRKKQSYSEEFKAEAAYHRTDLLEQRRPLMQTWADFVLPQ